MSVLVTLWADTSKIRLLGRVFSGCLGSVGEQINYFVGFGCVILFPLNNNMMKEPVKES